MTASVIIPVHNQEKTIGKAIESALNQRDADVELIVINDGSDDMTAENVKKHESRIKIINHNTKLGPYESRFDGIAAATGDWITFIDGDDFISRSAIADCLSTAYATKADVIQMRIKRHFNRLGITTGMRHQRYYIDKAFDSVAYNDRLFPIQCCGKLYRSTLLKSLVDNHIAYSGLWGEDRLFNLAIFAKSPNISICDSAKYIYRWGGFTSRQTDCLSEYVAIESLKRRFLNDNGLMTDSVSRRMKMELIKLIHYGTRQLIDSGQSRRQIIDRLANCGVDYSDSDINTCPIAIYNQSKYSLARIAKRLIRSLL